MEKPKLRWSYFELPGFVKEKYPGRGYVPIGDDDEDN